MFLLAFSVFAFGGVHAFPATEVTDTFYPQSLNNVNSLAWTNGTNGGIYSGPVGQSTQTAPYGTYNYCYMPHPRVDEYELPAVIANKSVNANLVFVEYLQRHHKRTPYNLFPNGGSTYWQCQNIQPYLFANAGKDIGAAVYSET